MGDEVTAVLVTRSQTVEEFGDEYVRPMEILATHAATAISNIRSRERRERVSSCPERRPRRDEMYDRLLRHDLGNDLQVMLGSPMSSLDRSTARLRSTPARSSARPRAPPTSSSASATSSRRWKLRTTRSHRTSNRSSGTRCVMSETTTGPDGRFCAVRLRYHVYGGTRDGDHKMSDATPHRGRCPHASASGGSQPRRSYGLFRRRRGRCLAGLARGYFPDGCEGPESSGTGFGLGFVRALTESYGGSVSVGESDAGGAEFRVTLERI